MFHGGVPCCGKTKRPTEVVRGPSHDYFLGSMGDLSVVLIVVVWSCFKSTLVVVPPISMSSEPSSFSDMVSFWTRPFVVSNRIVPLASLLFRSAPLILNGRPSFPS